MDKFMVAQCFSKMAGRYDDETVVHKASATSLLKSIVSSDINPVSVTDMGCGTGLFLETLKNQFPAATYFGCDFSEKMIEKAKGRAIAQKLFCSDALNVDVDVDLITSHFSLQWMLPLHDYVAKFLKHSKFVAIAVPLNTSFATWKGFLERNGACHNLYKLPGYEDFDIYENITISKEIKEYHMAFDRALDFAKYLKNLGASYTASTNPCLFKKEIFFKEAFTTSYQVLEIILKGSL